MPEPDTDEPVVQSWGQSERRQGGAHSWEELAADLEEDGGVDPSGPDPGTGGSEGQPDWARPDMRGFDEDLWPESLPSDGADGPGPSTAAGGLAAEDPEMPEVQTARGRLPVPAELDLGEVEVRQATARGSRPVVRDEEE